MKLDSFGEYVTAIRQERGWSIRHVAAAIGVPASTVSRVENGAIRVPSPEVFLGLITELDLDICIALGLCPPYGRITLLAMKDVMGRWGDDRTSPNTDETDEIKESRNE